MSVAVARIILPQRLFVAACCNAPVKVHKRQLAFKLWKREKRDKGDKLDMTQVVDKMDKDGTITPEVVPLKPHLDILKDKKERKEIKVGKENQFDKRSLLGRDFLTLKHFQAEDIKQLLWTAHDLKQRIKVNREVLTPLAGKNVSMIFEKRSTRTRLSTESGVAALGGHAQFLGPEDVHLGVNESVKDTARVVSSMSDAILARVYYHEDLEVMADEANVPVISGLSDMYHPLQILADFMTLQENFGYLRGLKLAWVGDGNNVLHSLMMGCTKLGVDLNIATPKGYEPDSTVLNDAVIQAAACGSQLSLTNNPVEAVYRADAIITDTWVSMGQEEEKQQRLKDFQGFQITRKMLKEAGADWVLLHCLPRKQEEVTDDVFYDTKHSLVWQEAENRKWTVMAVLLHVLSEYTPIGPRPIFMRGEAKVSK